MRQLPLPISMLLLRSHNAKSAKDRHDNAYFALEASARIALAARPPVDLGALRRAPLGEWVARIRAGDHEVRDPSVLDLFTLLTEDSGGAPRRRRSVTPRQLLDALPTYRNRVIGHGAVRDREFYRDAAETIAAGLRAAWRDGVFLAEDVCLRFVDSLAIDDRSARLARVLDLDGEHARVVDPDGTPVPPHVLPRRLYLQDGEDWPALHPLLLFREESGSFLIFNGFGRRPEYLDYATGARLAGRELEESFPHVTAELAERLAVAPDEDRGRSVEDSDEDDLAGYRLLEPLAKGAMGVLFLAEQRALGRRVVVKRLRPELMLDPVARARFRREVEALSRCEHENVVRILDSGASSEGPFHVMEHVEGETLADRLADRRDSADVVAAWIRDAARGLHHLHERGIVHRDVSPANVMLTADESRVVVTDLGLAKVDDASVSLSKSREAVVGTLRYMAPEQLERATGAVDRRADVYSLGAILHELLSGRPLHDGNTAASVMRQILLEDRAAPAGLGHEIPADLVHIGRRATARDPVRRYETAAAFADDLDRWLRGDPIGARPESLGYVLGLAARRHRAVLMTAGAAGLVLMALGAWSIRSVLQERDVARQERDAAADVVEFMVGLFESPSPASARGANLSARELLDQGARAVSDRSALEQRPLTTVRLGEAIGRSYLGLGLYRDAEETLRDTMTRAERDVAAPDSLRDRIALHLGLAHVRQGRFDLAESILVPLHDRLAERRGAEHAETLRAAVGLVTLRREQGRLEIAEQWSRRVSEALAHAVDPPPELRMESLAEAMLLAMTQGRHDDADRSSAELLDLGRGTLGPDHPDTLAMLADRAELLRTQDRPEEARALLSSVVAELERVKGESHPDVLTCQVNLAILHADAGRSLEAAAELEQLSAALEAALGPGHPSTLNAKELLATVYRDLERYDEALPLSESVLQQRRLAFDPGHPDVLASLNGLASSYRTAGRVTEARSLLRQGVREAKAALSDRHFLRLTLESNLGQVLDDCGGFEESEPIHRRVLEARRDALGAAHPSTLASLNALALHLALRGRAAEARAASEEVARGFEETLGADHPSTLTARHNLAARLLEQGDTEEGERLLRAVVEDRRRVLGDAHHETLTSEMSLAVHLWNRGRVDEAEDLLIDVEAGFEEVLGADSREAITAGINLAVFHGRAGKTAEAQTVLRRIEEPATRLLGPTHTKTLWLRTERASIDRQLGLLAQAETRLRAIVADAREAGEVAAHSRLVAQADLASLLTDLGRPEEALALNEEVLEDRLRLDGIGDENTITAQDNLAVNYAALGRNEDALRLAEAALEGRRARFGEDGEPTINSLMNVGALEARLGDSERAEKRLRDALDRADRGLGRDHSRTLVVLENLAGVLADQGELEEAEGLYLRQRDANVRIRGPGHLETAISNQNLGALYRDAGRYGEAIECLEAALPVFQGLGAGHEYALMCRSTLADSQLGAGRPHEALALIRSVLALTRAGSPDLGKRQAILARALEAISDESHSRR